MRYLRMQRSLRLKRRTPRQNEPEQGPQRNHIPEREAPPVSSPRRNHGENGQ